MGFEDTGDTERNQQQDGGADDDGGAGLPVEMERGRNAASEGAESVKTANQNHLFGATAKQARTAGRDDQHRRNQ